MSRHELISRRAPPALAPKGPDRREALRLLAVGSAAAMASCSAPPRRLVPFVDFNGPVASGEPARYATALELSGYGRGVLVVVEDGRPIKVQGNPNHPATLGSTDPFLEGAVLDLFDPQRAKTPSHGRTPVDWNTLTNALQGRLAQHRTDHGAGLAVLTGRVLSPTLLRQLAALQAAFPAMRRVRWEPVHDDAERAGAALAYGRVLDLRPQMEAADVIVALDADPLGPGPDQIRLARGFAARRRPEARPMSRLYVLESAYTPTGALADARAAARPELIHNAAIALAAALGAPLQPPPLPAPVAQLVARAAQDLGGGQVRGLILAGRTLPPQIHALAAWMNERCRAPIDVYEPLDPVAEPHAQSLAELSAAMRTGAVRTLIVLDSDPVYGAPPELEFEAAMRAVPFSLHAGLYRGATGRAAQWRAPLSHAFESWGDVRAFDGAASLVQPLVAPLYDTRSATELLASALSLQPGADLDAVTETWATLAGADALGWRTRSLVAGVIDGAAAKPAGAPAARLPVVAPAAIGSPLALVVRPSAQVWDGRFAANAWLQECPDPLTKETWGASLAISPADAQRLGLADGQPVALTAGKGLTQAAVRIDPRQAQGAVALPMGFGHSRLGPVADGVGADVAPFRGVAQAFVCQGVDLTPGGGASKPPTTQYAFDLEGRETEDFPLVAASAYAMPGGPVGQPDILDPPKAGPIAWAMVIDTSVCIGCNACVVSCQAENNVPVIGPEEISRHRDMHWLRVDRYERENGLGGFQPVPCMQCEEAPCEPVCPVEASVHDSEGVNDQVYNRCIGTRFCESNCPYKVRRFNFLDYEHWPVYGALDARSIEAQRNPNVTVRERGVMEKCNYCMQRTSAARRAAEKQDRAIRDGDVTTACQDACPTRAISFGNMSDPAAAVNPKRADPRHYVLLEELRTRPRTTYLARAVNPPGSAGEGQA